MVNYHPDIFVDSIILPKPKPFPGHFHHWLRSYNLFPNFLTYSPGPFFLLCNCWNNGNQLFYFKFCRVHPLTLSQTGFIPWLRSHHCDRDHTISFAIKIAFNQVFIFRHCFDASCAFIAKGSVRFSVILRALLACAPIVAIVSNTLCTVFNRSLERYVNKTFG